MKIKDLEENDSIDEMELLISKNTMIKKNQIKNKNSQIGVLIKKNYWNYVKNKKKKISFQIFKFKFKLKRKVKWLGH